MPRQSKSSLAAERSETRAARLSQLEVQRDAVAHSDVPDEPTDARVGDAVWPAGEDAPAAEDVPSAEQLDAVDVKHDEAEAEGEGEEVEICSACDGRGVVPTYGGEEDVECSACGGTGKIDENAAEGEDDDEPQGGGFVTELDAPRLTNEDLGIPQPPIHPVEFPTRRDYTIAVQALQDRKAKLDDTAKKLTAAGYPKEARIVSGDAAAISEMIMPQLRTQIEMPLVTPSQLNFGVKNAMRALVHAFATRCAKAGDVRADVTAAEDTMLDQLAIKIGAFGRDVAEKAFSAGVAYRESDPAVIAEKALPSLHGTGVV